MDNNVKLPSVHSFRKENVRERALKTYLVGGNFVYMYSLRTLTPSGTTDPGHMRQPTFILTLIGNGD